MKFALLTIFSTTCYFLWSQQAVGNGTRVYQLAPQLEIAEVKFKTPDLEILRVEDEINDNTGSAPWRFGYNNYTSLNMENSGSWYDLPDGSRIWSLVITCKDALTVNLTMENVKLPKGNELYIYNPDKSFVLGAYRENHLYQGNLGTELVPGPTAIVEYYIPSTNKEKTADLTISTVTHGYRTALEFQQKAFGSSGNCNKNVNCPEGELWQNERNAVVMIVSGSNGFCSGALVNNVLFDGKPYVLTADHCYSNPVSWVFRFNWQSADCSNPTVAPTFQSLSGAVLRARASASDFCLVEITGGLESNTVPASFSPYFLGWDNSGTPPLSGTCIHHPAGDIKKISIENDPLISTSFGGSSANSHWGVTGWDSGVTESGSSGSPLLDQNHRLIGQLHGGTSSCGSSQLSDEFGKFSYSWDPLGSSSTNQLKYWLDPNSSGAKFIDGYDPTGASAALLDAGLTSPKGVTGTLCNGTVAPQVTIINSGSQTLTSAIISYGFNGVEDQVYSWTGSLNQWQTAIVTLPMVNLVAGSYIFSATISSPNSGVDQNNLNNVTTSPFTAVVDGEKATLILDLDCYGSETSWLLSDNLSGLTLFTGNGYPDNSPGVITQDFCLNEGCYVFTIKDAWNDGMSGCTAGNGGNGSYQIMWNGIILSELLETEADFGKQYKQTFCISLNGLDDLAENQITVYPNPADKYLIIKVPVSLNIAAVTLMDLSGKVCATRLGVKSETLEIDLAGVSSGFYTLKVETTNGNVFKQIIVK
jgi:hypothetical protein